MDATFTVSIESMFPSYGPQTQHILMIGSTMQSMQFSLPCFMCTSACIIYMCVSDGLCSRIEFLFCKKYLCTIRAIHHYCYCVCLLQLISCTAVVSIDVKFNWHCHPGKDWTTVIFVCAFGSPCFWLAWKMWVYQCWAGHWNVGCIGNFSSAYFSHCTCDDCQALPWQ